MPAKIRLQRHGKKKNSFFHIVIADERAPRDGKFIEKIGTYNPNTNPATIDLEFDKALSWLKNGAQPTDTAKAILSYEGVIFKNHLDKGVTKGAFDQASADKKFEDWKADKLNKIQQKTETVLSSKDAELKKRLEAEAEVNKKRQQDIIAKNSEMAQEAAQASAPAEEAAPVAEASEETAPVAEAPATEATETKTEKAVEAKTEEATEAKTEEAPAKEEATVPAAEAEVKEEAKPEAKADAPAAEAKKEEAPEAEAKEAEGEGEGEEKTDK